jgi:hypothetical protein
LKSSYNFQKAQGTSIMPEKPTSGPGAALLPKSALLTTESDEDFDRLRDELQREIKPKGPVEQIFVADFAHLTLEIVRLRRCKTALINSELPNVLKRLLHETVRLGFRADETYDADEGAADEGGADEEGADEEGAGEVDPEYLAVEWFTDEAAKQEVADLLASRGLDVSAIEAEAIMSKARVLELIDRLLASAEARRIKALRFIAEYRASFANHLRDRSDRIIEGELATVQNSPESAPAA